MKKSFAISVVLGSLFLSTVASAQFITNYSFLGGGPRARGMGGASIGVADDPSTATWNPAGLTLLDRVQTGESFSYLRPRVKGEPSLTAGTRSFLNSFSSNKNMGVINYASFILPGKVGGRQMVGALAFRRAEELFQDIALASDSTRYKRHLEGSLNVLNLAVGTKITDAFAVGAGLNVYLGGYDRTEQINFTVTDTALYHQPYGAQQIFRYNWNQQSNFRGVNFELSTLYLGPKYRLGAIVRTPFQLKDKFETRRGDTLFVDNVPNFFYSRGLFTPRTATELGIPLSVGVGGSYKATEALTVAVDFEARLYSQADLSVPDSILDPASPLHSQNLNWSDDFQVRFGLEYLLQSGGMKFPLRLGARNEPQIFEDARLLEAAASPYSSDVNNERLDKGTPIFAGRTVRKQGIVGTAGAGLQMAQIHLDLTYELGTVKPQETGSYVDPSAPKTGGVRSTTFTTAQDHLSHQVTFSFTGYF